ncbi:Nn.00g065600.m01.CDS01 [Neocucurbitaria sp. VM-36]
MAVLDDVPGLNVEILVGGRPLHEYEDDEEASPKAVTKYVEAQSGAEFYLRSTFSAPFPTQYGVQMKVSVDGSSVRASYAKPEMLYKQHGYTQRGISYQENGQWFHRNYCFTPLSIVEEAEGSADISDLREELAMKGCITLSFSYITNIRTSEQAPRGTRIEELKALGIIPEKALKGDARSHQATLSAPHAIRSRSTKSTYDFVDREPFATYHFKYRSMAALRALRVVPAERAIDIPLEERPADERTPGELREASRRMRRQDAETDTTKQEGEVTGQIKREHPTDAQDDEVTFVETRVRKRSRVDSEVIVID